MVGAVGSVPLKQAVPFGASSCSFPGNLLTVAARETDPAARAVGFCQWELLVWGEFDNRKSSLTGERDYVSLI